MEPYTRNGGIIGKYRKYGTNVVPVIGTSYATIQYVGGRTQTGAGGTTAVSVALTGLSGGLATSPSANDIVIIAFAVGGVTNISYRISGYTAISDVYADDTYDANLQLGYKFMGTTPDTTATITGGSGAASTSYTVIVNVWRNVDLTNPIDNSASLTTINSGTPGFQVLIPSILPARIIVAATTAHAGGVGSFSAPSLSNFLTVGNGASTYDVTLGMGNVLTSSAFYSPAAWTHTIATSILLSAASTGVVLRPASTPIYGNKQNSGIWDLATTSTAPNIAPNNVFSQPRDIHAWASSATTTSCTISRDTTKISPFNNTTLNMTVTGSDSSINTTGTPTWLVASATAGQVWEMSVWAISSIATTGTIRILEANSSSTVTNTNSLIIPLGKTWRQYKLRTTLANYGTTTASIQIQLLGPITNSIGTHNIWFDGLQVKRVV